MNTVPDSALGDEKKGRAGAGEQRRRAVLEWGFELRGRRHRPAHPAPAGYPTPSLAPAPVPTALPLTRVFRLRAWSHSLPLHPSSLPPFPYVFRRQVWSHFLEHGTHALGATITANLELAALLARRVDAHPRLRRLAPAALNIVVFRYEPPRLASPPEGGAAQPGQRAAPRGDSPRTASRKTQAAAYDAVGGLAAAGAIGSLPAGTLRHGSSVTSSGRKASPMGARSTPVPSPGSTLLTSDAAVGAVSHTLRGDASAPVNAAVRSGSPALLPRNGAEPGSGREGVVWACSGDSDSPHGDHSPATPSGKLIGAVQLNGSRFVSPSAARACVDEEVGAAGSSRQAVAELEAALDSLNDAIVVELQERGIAAPSTARVRGRLAIRVNLTNHRTREEDLDILLRAVCGIGAELAPSWPEGALVAQ